MRIYFARHGESQANVLRQISNRGLVHPLTLKGREQVEALARRLQGRPISRIYSSPLLRAIEMSIILANRLGVEYSITGALREFDCGILEGRSDEAAWQAWREQFDAWLVHRRWDTRIEGGESFDDLRARFVPFVERLVDEYGQTGTEVVCVSHGGLYWMMLPIVLKNVDKEFIAQHGLHNAACIAAEPRPDGLYCVEWNGQPVPESTSAEAI
jgi:broad specificity phosphatase PhoE